MEDELRRKTDTICITMQSRANFQSRHESGAFVGKSIILQSLDPRLPNKGNLVRSISDQMVLPTDIINGKSKFYAFYVETMFGSSRADYL